MPGVASRASQTREEEEALTLHLSIPYLVPMPGVASRAEQTYEEEVLTLHMSVPYFGAHTWGSKHGKTNI